MGRDEVSYVNFRDNSDVRFNYKKTLIIGILSLALLLIIVGIWLFSSGDEENGGANNNLGDNSLNNIYCDSQGELSDQCYYDKAIFYNDNSFCRLIENFSLRDKCLDQIMVFGE